MTNTPVWLERTELLITEKNLKLLGQTNVLIVGLGGVGSFAAEFLARAGIGSMTIVDGDVVDTIKDESLNGEVNHIQALSSALSGCVCRIAPARPGNRPRSCTLRRDGGAHRVLDRQIFSNHF